MEKADPLIRDALETALERGFIPSFPDAAPAGAPPGAAAPDPIETDPAIVTKLIGRIETSIAALKHDIAILSGTELVEFILADIGELKRLLFIRRAIRCSCRRWKPPGGSTASCSCGWARRTRRTRSPKSVPHNVTSEMGLALLDVADVVRPNPGVVAFLQQVSDDGFVDELVKLEGGPAAEAAIRGWLDQYGMRCPSEIDITRPRWSERPSMLVPVIVGNVKNFQAGEGKRRFERGRREAQEKAQELLERLRALPDGRHKAEEAERMIERVRAFIGYREFPKYGMVRRLFVYKRALLAEAERLMQGGVLHEREDVFYLTLDELHDAVRTNRVDGPLIRRRRDAFRSYQALTPPRVLTSDGEALNGQYRRDDFPAGALVGVPVSAGTVEGRARVVLDMAHADLEPGDILVTAYTDPSWTPLFVTAAALVTEVGGLMTHGAVIAREYGLPAVVGVEHATRLIRDGQQIRVHGTDGYVEVLY